LGISGILGTSGIENRKPKIVNCKFFLSFQPATTTKKIFYKNKMNFFLVFFVSVWTAEGREGEGGGKGREGEGEGREMRPR
jgi:hypothetical protein